MAQSSDNLFTDGFRGTVGGNMTFRRKKSGKVVVSKKRGASKNPPNEAQVGINSRFKRAIKYAKSIVLNAIEKLKYAAAATGDQSAFNVAMRDAFTLPEVSKIDKANYRGLATDNISIEASDDFEVAAVKVSIHTATGELVEEGNAVLDENGLLWKYSVSGENESAIGSTIKATAFDKAGNEGSLEITV